MAELNVMIGLPGGGKSFWAEYVANQNDSVLIEADKIRKEVFGNRQTRETHQEVFAYCHRMIKDGLNAEKNVVFDATNLSYKHRKRFIEIARTCGATVVATLVATPWDECLSNNENRERTLPIEVMENMRKNFTVPFAGEGWDKMSIIWNSQNLSSYTERFSISDLFREMDGFEQNNRHHSMTLGGHCRGAREIGKAHGDSLRVAGQFHDIGKLWTKKFETMKGVPTKDAHYFNHENVGAYMAMPYLKSEQYSDEFILEVCALIQFHMRPYQAKSERAKNKLMNLTGARAYVDLMKLHEADKAAH